MTLDQEALEAAARVVLVRDNNGFWYLRGVFSIIRDADADHMIYRCDRPISGPHATIGQALDALIAFDAAEEPKP